MYVVKNVVHNFEKIFSAILLHHSEHQVTWPNNTREEYSGRITLEAPIKQHRCLISRILDFENAYIYVIYVSRSNSSILGQMNCTNKRVHEPNKPTDCKLSIFPPFYYMKSAESFNMFKYILDFFWLSVQPACMNLRETICDKDKKLRKKLKNRLYRIRRNLLADCC